MNYYFFSYATLRNSATKILAVRKVIIFSRSVERFDPLSTALFHGNLVVFIFFAVFSCCRSGAHAIRSSVAKSLKWANFDGRLVPQWYGFPNIMPLAYIMSVCFRETNSIMSYKSVLYRIVTEDRNNSIFCLVKFFICLVLNFMFF